MPDVIHKDSFLYLFADDTKVFRKIETKQDVEKLQQDGEMVQRLAATVPSIQMCVD